MTETPGQQVWLDKGDPDCEGEPHWQDRNGRRHFTCPDCSLHWYIVRESNPPALEYCRTCGHLVHDLAPFCLCGCRDGLPARANQ